MLSILIVTDVDQFNSVDLSLVWENVKDKNYQFFPAKSVGALIKAHAAFSTGRHKYILYCRAPTSFIPPFI